MTPANHLRFIVGSLTFLALLCILVGGGLLYAGFQSGELFVGIAGSVTGGLVGMISMRQTPQTGASGAITTEVVNPPNKPVETHETEH